MSPISRPRRTGGPRRPEPRVGGAEERAVLHVKRQADGSPGSAPRHELAEDLDVVVFGVEEPFVQGLLERHQRRRDRASNPTSQAGLQHWSSPSGFVH
jgi:hypothetical protein